MICIERSRYRCIALLIGVLLGWDGGQLGLLLGQVAPVVPQRAAKVLVVSGRRFVADVDVRTDAKCLWLRWNKGASYMLRPIDWQRVVSVELEGETYSGRELREAVAVLREVAPVVSSSRLAEKEASWVRYESPPAVVSAASAWPDVPPRWALGALDEQTGRPRVRSLAIEVAPANWDEDVEVDGLVLNVYPLDAAGFVVPVRATIEVELILAKRATKPSGEAFVRAERWVEHVCPEDFFTHGAQYRLPFRQVQPEFDLRWAPKGLIHARLSVPGEGVFAASASMVRVRPYSAVRDRLEQTSGGRFFEIERTGRSR